MALCQPYARHLSAVIPSAALSSTPRVVCYYTNWSVYRPGTAKFNPQNINPYLCTHLVYAFGGFTKDNTLKPFDKYQDIEKAFRDGGKPKDRENYAKLVKELRDEFDRESEKTGKPRLLLTMAVPAALKSKSKKREVSEENSEEDEEEEEDEEWTVMFPNKNAMGPVAYKGNQWVGYDDIDIVKKKGDSGIICIMFWSIDNDDFRGSCYGKPYPLIEAAKEAYISKLGSTENAITESSKSSDFKCKDEGFFPHPRDCKKYFWCLDSGPSDLGIVAHQFTCPSGLYFNKAADSCDFSRNVLCKMPSATAKPTTKPTPKTTVTTTTTSTTTTRRPLSEEEEFSDEVVDTAEEDAEDPKVIKELIDLIKKVAALRMVLPPLHRRRSTRNSTRRFNSNIGSEGGVQNSRSGPQNAGIEPSSDRDKYVTINRSRQQTTTEPLESLEEDETGSEEVQQVSRSRNLQPSAAVNSATTARQYVNIRRTRPTTVPDDEDDTPSRYRNSEEVQESKEIAIERKVPSQAQPQYSSIIRTRSTTLSPTEEIYTPEPTTILSVQISSLLNAPSPTDTDELEANPIQTTELIESETTSTRSSSALTTTTSTTPPTTRRNLLRRRGSTNPPTTTSTAATSTQVSSRNYSFIRRRRPLSQLNNLSDAQESNELTRKIRSTTPDSREVESDKVTNRSPQIRRLRYRFEPSVSRTEDSIPAAASQVSRGQFRPVISEDELLSLTPIDVDDEQLKNEKTDDILLTRADNDQIKDSEVSATTVDERRTNILPRGRSRFTITTEALKQSVTSESPLNQRRQTFARFTPRPFGRSTIRPADLNNEDENVEKEKPINRARLALFRPRVNIPSNSAVVQGRKLPFPSRVLTSTPISTILDEGEDDDDKEVITLSETAIEEKEHDNDYEDITTQAPGRTRVTVKKIKASDDSLTNESIIDDNGKRKFRIIRRRPTVSTTLRTSTETITTPVNRIRKIIRKKIKPLEEEKIIPSTTINAGFNDIPQNIQNYGEKTRYFTTPVEETPETTTIEEDLITDPILAYKDNFVSNKIKKILDSSSSKNDYDLNNESKNDLSQNKYDLEEEPKPNVIVEEDDKSIDLSDAIETNSKETQITSDEPINVSQNITSEKDGLEISTEPLIPEKITEENAYKINETIGSTPHIDTTSPSSSSSGDFEKESQTLAVETDQTVTETTTTSTTTQTLTSSTARSRSPYRPSKRPFTSTTESSSSPSSRTFSRKYNPGVYTSPSTVERPDSFRRPTTRRPLFSRTFTRKTLPTVRTTPRYQEEEEEEEYSDEELLDEEPESPLVFVPPSKLYGRKPDSEEYENEEEEVVEEEEEIPEEENYDDNPPSKLTPSTRKPLFKPRIVNSNTFRTSTTTTELPKRPLPTNQNKTLIYNRFANKPVNDLKKRVQNVPIGYNTPKSINTTTTNPFNDTKTTPEERKNVDVTTLTSHDEINTTTATYDIISTTDYLHSPGNSDDKDILNQVIEVDNTTDDYLENTEATTNYPNTVDDTYIKSEFDNSDKTQLPTTDNEIYETTTENFETTTNVPKASPIVKTQFDKLFSVSRVVEVSSKLDKHRLNKNNETTLIEEGKVIIEKKPTVDKIGEVSRFSLIKIVEDDIPIYLTKLGHVYPVDNPPNNPIRIDEARNARALFDYSDIPKENLVASESMNEAYRHINKITRQGKENRSIIGKDHVEHLPNDDFLSFINDDNKLTKSDQGFSNWQFVPAAYENDLAIKVKPTLDVVTPRVLLTNPSTLSLEGLFKTERPTARKVGDNSQPFVVYSASVPTQTEAVNIVKLDILKPETGRSIVTFARGQEYKGPDVEEEVTVRYPFNISVISNTEITSTMETISNLTSSTSTTTTETSNINKSPIIELLTTTEGSSISVNEPTTIISETLPTTETETSSPITTEAPIEEITTVKISALDSKRSKYFPRRPIIKPSNITRFSAIARPGKNNATLSKQKTTKAPFNPNKNRYSNRAQNVPIDLRKSTSTKSARAFTTETPRSTTERRVFKPIRPIRPAFVPRRLTTPPTTVEEP
ncbi:unnamed protein product [Leptidea sinapis]|uniref:Uncharacterized protein n=1 Tax=Leptidea sinapis TaxID=189913 RepID=A0A5E4Q0M4_9NEOP|nr:unnamed protein product [Leptidea sinapis]